MSLPTAKPYGTVYELHTHDVVYSSGELKGTTVRAYRIKRGDKPEAFCGRCGRPLVETEIVTRPKKRYAKDGRLKEFACFTCMPFTLSNEPRKQVK